MVTLSLLRHAKSKWGDSGLEDIDRPLAPRGIKAAPAMGRFMQAQGITPGLVLCSPAQRTRQTLDLVLPFLTPKPETRVEDALYLASPQELMGCLREAGGGYGHVMLIGHNPGLHLLGRELAGTGAPELVSALSAKFPTCGLAVLTFDTSWEGLAPSGGHLKVFMAPKRLAGQAA